MPLYEEIIQHKFDFVDEEISQNFVSLMKGITVNLPEELLLTFLVTKKFILFNATRIFCFYRERMVMTASRTVLLSIIAFNHPIVLDYILSSGFLLSLVIRLRKNLYEIDREIMGTDDYRLIQELVGNTTDIIFYINDIFLEGILQVSEQLSSGLVNLVDLLIQSITSETEQRECVSISLALFTLVHLLRIITYKPTVDSIYSSLCTDSTAKNVLFAILQSKDETLITLVLLVFHTVLSHKSIVNLVENDSSLIQYMVELMGYSFKPITSNLIVSILSSQDIEKIPIELLEKKMISKVPEFEILLNSPHLQATMFSLIETEYNSISQLNFSEKIVCPWHLLLPSIYDPPPRTPLHQRNPQTITEKTRFSIYQFLLYLKYLSSLTNARAPIPPLVFLRPSVQSSYRYSMHLSISNFKTLFSKLTHKPIPSALQTSHFRYLPNNNYSKILLILDEWLPREECLKLIN